MGGPYYEHKVASLFGRLSYNYDERYMFQATVRRDGSSRFGTNKKWGTFPSVSLGWNVMNEKFMEKTRNWLTNMKVRFRFGVRTVTIISPTSTIPPVLRQVAAATTISVRQAPWSMVLSPTTSPTRT